MEYQALSDKELIARYCDARSDRAAFDELWRRYTPTARKYATHLVYLCPRSYSRDMFIEDVFSDTQDKVFRGIRGYQGRVPFSGWLYRICERAAIGRGREIRGRGSQPHEFVELTEHELARRGEVFRDKVKQDPMYQAIRSERRVLLDDILDRHSASEKGYRSITAIALNVFYDYEVREVAKLTGTYEREIFRLFKLDYPRLKAALAARGIRCVKDALAANE